MMVVLIENEKQFDELVRGEKPLLVDFYADWCGPCRMQSPIVDAIAEENSDVVVAKVNVDDVPEVAERFGIVSIPTLLIFKNGSVVKQFVGVTMKATILASLK
ncbi:thioredoxin [Anaeroplasma bactoclasticum]|jgi:thioredoxin 1|uniref:Thioredoxin n=1 Tax=Anaeroplasma bactoclasticum TaxID=2088 RepID=A0A397RXA8_9MOLU|nr:thioredoxin [Anaeroplasma bactoclasticum]RIA78358.1 thioredoxin [Anaeroplasma bactoclasticum]